MMQSAREDELEARERNATPRHAARDGLCLQATMDSGALKRSEAVDEFAWEHAKENVLPIRQGRNVHELNAALHAQDKMGGRMKVEAEMKQIEERIRTYSGEDPLGMWVQYVKWLEAHLPEDTRKKFAVLEKCTRELKDDVRYKNDVRYIRIWLRYADLVSNPKDIFKYLYQHKIGEHLALFYAGWAWVLENVSNYAQADKIYLKAIQKKAQPEELIHRKHQEFQSRMSRHWLRMEAERAQNAGREDPDERQTLGAVDENGEPQPFMIRQQQRLSKSTKCDPTKPVFKIFEDAGMDEEVDFLSGPSHWENLETHQQQNKENDVNPVQWNQSALYRPRNDEHARLTGDARAGGEHTDSRKLQVFVDEEFSSNAAPKRKHEDASAPRSLTLRQRLVQSTTEEEMLARKPMKNFDDEKKPSEQKPKTDRQKPPAKKDAKKLPEKAAYDESLLLGADGEVLSFEEVRALRLTKKASKKVHHPSAAPSHNVSSGKTHGAGRNSFLANVNDITSDLNSVPKKTSSTSSFKKNTFPIGGPSTRVESNFETLNTAAQEDMTINTRVAMADVNDMFCSPSRETVTSRQGNAWEVVEEDPVERKLHFSIFDDSVDSIAPADQSYRAPESVRKEPFQIFSDDAKTKSVQSSTKSSNRKPLGAREDLVRASRLTNKDVIMKMLEDIIDPYSHFHRSKMVHSPSVHKQLFEEMTSVHRYGKKLPALPVGHPVKRKLKKSITVELDGIDSVEILGVLGTGAFASVFSVNVIDNGCCQKNMAMKVRSTLFGGMTRDKLYVSSSRRPRQTWDGNTASFIKPRHGYTMSALFHDHKFRLWFHTVFTFSRFVTMALFAYCPLNHNVLQNGSLMLMHKGRVGTLHDLLNAYRKVLLAVYLCRQLKQGGTLNRSNTQLGKPFPEILAVYYTIKMLYAVELLHSVRILHGDIKPDNWLIDFGAVDLTPERTSCQEYRTGGIRLIDFGRAIDTCHYSPGTKFAGSCHTKGFQCVEMLSGQLWTNQIDTFGICGTVHCMLFGEYMEVHSRKTRDERTKWTIKKPFKRYWSVALWKELFDTLINVPSCDEQPSLGLLRRRFEGYLTTESSRMKELEDTLARQDRFVSECKI
ncbi:TPA: hypothetical protein N0F65_006834 [Lagenidium giganteum]|uniref:Uncharacterized protein n=1 Tax=Lagenidium giganteum TaxID=4803 RepID=A0AAV2ZCF5_9STRA|nr:TPA: hypothetical protein N0F65_006834 [Lagenidium giganteum]